MLSIAGDKAVHATARGLGAKRSTVFARVERVKSKSIPGVVRWSFLLFVFTIPFEDADVGPMSGSLSLAKMSGLLFFALYVFYYNPVLSKRSFPRPRRAMWWFLGYFVVYVFNGMFIPEEFLSSFATRLITLCQLIVLFWICSDLFEEEKMARSALWTFSIASVLLAVSSLLHMFGIATQVAQGRETALEYNPGTLGVLMAFSIIILVGLQLNKASKKSFISQVLLLALSVPLLKLMLDTGSRGAFATLMTGSLVYLLPNLNLKTRLTAMAIGVVAIGGSLYMAVHNPDYSERWKQTYYDRNVSGRDQIYPAAIGMIAERPIFGWQPILNWYELGLRLGVPQRDAHSLFLHLLLEVGMVGAMPFLIGLWLCTRSAWKARMGPLGSLPLALMLAALTSNLTDTFIARKPVWLAFALTLAAAPRVAKRNTILLKAVRRR
jgi:O-antigen ligase